MKSTNARAFLIVALGPVALAGCAGGGNSRPSTAPAARPVQTAPPPQTGTPPPAAATGFRAPKVMNLPGLENVIGRDAQLLANQFGQPRLSVKEGDAVKLQFAGNACVLDIFLYPLRQGAVPTATYVDARRASDGREVDRAACVAALRR